MIIKGLKYARYAGMAREWRVVGKDDDANEAYTYFGNLNLLVGKNASGKSRSLTIMRELANLLSGRQLVKDSTYHTQTFDVLFEDSGIEYRYFLDFKEKEIISEKLFIDNQEVLNREEGYLISLGEKRPLLPASFEDKLLINRKKSDTEFYFAPLVYWAFSLRNFLFTDQIEKDKFVSSLESIEEDDQDVEDVGILIPLFHLGQKEYGEKFEAEILECMNEIGYTITDIDIKQSKRGYSINVEEDGKYMVSQKEMSHGMFRALSLFVILIHARLGNLSVCILVDDIGEGLDHERSKSFVDLVIKKTFNTNIQYFMTTNDRYVMNHIALKYWSVIDRKGSKSIFYNIFNSADIFEDFKYTGLNNFDFFTTDFYSLGFGAQDEEGDEE